MKRAAGVGTALIAALLGLAVLALWPPRVTAPARRSLVLEGVTVVNPGRSRDPNQRLEIREGRISSVAPGAASGPYAGAFVLPGLVDMHSHYPPPFALGMRQTSSLLALAHGVTSVRDTGGLLRKLDPIVARMRALDAIAPRVYFSGPLLDGASVVYDGDARPEIGIANPTPESAAQTGA